MHRTPATRNPLDFAPAFVFDGPRGPEYSSSIPALFGAGAPRDLDDEAVALFLRLGFFVGADTPFRAIRAATPPVSPPPKAHALNRRQVANAFLEHFSASIRRCLPSQPYVLPLSGGCDSRHILLELIDAGCAPRECVTVKHHPPRGDSDTLVAARLCARLGIPHRVLPAVADRLSAEEEKNARSSYGTAEHVQFMPLARYLASATRETYDGIAGDVLSQSRYLDPKLLELFRVGRLGGAADFLLDGFGKEGLETTLRWMLTDSAQRRFSRARAHERLVRELRFHAGAPNPIASFFFWNRTRRAIALSPFALFAPVEVHAPFLDREVVECLMATPADSLMDRRLHTDAVAARWPDLADVPYAIVETDAARSTYHRTVATGLLRRLIRSHSELLRVPSLLARCAAAAVDGNGARIWFVSRVMWLWQVERIACGKAAG